MDTCHHTFVQTHRQSRQRVKVNVSYGLRLILNGLPTDFLFTYIIFAAVELLSQVLLFWIPWTVALQAPLSMG